MELWRGRSQWRLGGSKLSPGGSVDKFSQFYNISTRTSDPNPNQREKLDPNPDLRKSDADPQAWTKEYV
jgi:hypothetical protein